ncbi:MAG: hypothetical protein AB7J32_19155 [Pseudonocardia sp.]
MNMRRTTTAVINVPATDIDLEGWLFGLSDADYQACARGHHGAGTYNDEHGRGMVNVESIGGNLIVQHYRPVRADSSDVEMYSPASRIYLLHLFPLQGSVRWWLKVTPKSDSSSNFTCTVHVDLHPVLRVLGRFIAAGWFLERHVTEETAGFVADIVRKRGAARPAPVPSRPARPSR